MAIERELLIINPLLHKTPRVLKDLVRIAEEEGVLIAAIEANKLRAPHCRQEDKTDSDIREALWGVLDRLRDHPDPDVQGAIAWLEEQL